MPRHLFTCIIVFCLAFVSGCAQYKNRRGVDALGQPELTAGLVKGQTTRQEVMDLLGPPSQVISLDDGTVLYYLFEHSEGDGLILILYNRVSIDTRYDRAIFFFDGDNRLTDYAIRARGAADL